MFSRILACVFCMLFAVTVQASSGGDTDGDGDIDLGDLNDVRNHFGEMGIPVAGDTNEDYSVDLDDLDAVRNNFGIAGDPTAMREPASIQIVGMSLVFAVARRWRPTALNWGR